MLLTLIPVAAPPPSGRRSLTELLAVVLRNLRHGFAHYASRTTGSTRVKQSLARNNRDLAESDGFGSLGSVASDELAGHRIHTLAGIKGTFVTLD